MRIELSRTLAPEARAGTFGWCYEAGQLSRFRFFLFRMMEDPSTGGGVRVLKPKSQ